MQIPIAIRSQKSEAKAMLKSNSPSMLFLFLSIGLCISAIHAEEPVSIESLLAEMVDRDPVARFPQVDFRLKQASSYDRASKTPEKPRQKAEGCGLGQRRVNLVVIRLTYP